MTSPPLTDDELAAYACDELEPAARQGFEQRLAADPAKAAEAMRLCWTMARLRHRGAVSDVQAEADEDDSDRRMMMMVCDELSPDDRLACLAELAGDPQKATECFALGALVNGFRCGRTARAVDTQAFTHRLRQRLADEKLIADDDGRSAEVSQDEASHNAGEGRPSPPRAFVIGLQQKLSEEIREHEANAGAAVHRRRKWRIAVAAAAAIAGAGLATGLIVAWLGYGAQPAYAITDLPWRVTRLPSMYAAGAAYGDSEAQWDQPVPVIVWVERPYSYWYSTEHFQKREGYRWSNGRRYQVVNHDRRECTTGAEDELFARMRSASLLQHRVVPALSGDASQQYQVLRSELINGVHIDVMEQVKEWGNLLSRRLIWYDAVIGLPLKTQVFRSRKPNPPHLIMEYDDIGLNPPPEIRRRIGMSPPPGYQIIHRDRDPRDYRAASGLHMGLRGVLRFVFNVDNRAILVCWTYYHVDRPGEADLGTQPSLAVTRQQDSSADWTDGPQRIRDDFDDGVPWYWSILIPKDEDALIGTGFYLFALHLGEYRTGFGIRPLRFAPDELDELVELCQRRTLGPGAAADSEFTLDDVGAMIDRYHAAKTKPPPGD